MKFGVSVSLRRVNDHQRPPFRFLDVFNAQAPGAAWRSAIVPHGVALECSDDCDQTGQDNDAAILQMSRRNYSWSQLMARIFEADVLRCPDCGGRMKILAAIQSPEIARKILDSLGLPSRAPPVSPARPNRSHPASRFL